MYKSISSLTLSEPPNADDSPFPPGTDRDKEVFVRFFAGDDTAFAEIFDRHHYRLFLYCVKIVGNAQQAEDLTQEIWERLVRARTQGKEIESPTRFLLRSARNLCIDHLRTRRSHDSLNDLPESQHPMDARELSGLEELVVLSLERLPFTQREVLILNAYSGYRFGEIAEMLGEEVGAVRMRASRARQHLGKIIAAMLGVEEDRRATDDPSEEHS